MKNKCIKKEISCWSEMPTIEEMISTKKEKNRCIEWVLKPTNQLNLFDNLK